MFLALGDFSLRDSRWRWIAKGNIPRSRKMTLMTKSMIALYLQRYGNGSAPVRRARVRGDVLVEACSAGLDGVHKDGDVVADAQIALYGIPISAQIG